MDNSTINLGQVYDWGKANRELVEKIIKADNTQATLGLVPAGLTVIDLQSYIPQRPRRKEVAEQFTSVASFVQYVNEQKSQFTRIFGKIEKNPYTFQAIIDYHETAGGQADWCRHRAELALSLSDQFQRWTSISSEFMEQSAFVEFLKDNRLDICEPNNADILTLCMELDAHVDSRCTSKVPTNAGIAFSFVEDIQTSRGGEKVEVPQSIKLKIPVFREMQECVIDCDFKFRLQSGRMLFGIRMLGMERLIRDAVTAARAEIEKNVEIPVYI